MLSGPKIVFSRFYGRLGISCCKRVSSVTILVSRIFHKSKITYRPPPPHCPDDLNIAFSFSHANFCLHLFSNLAGSPLDALTTVWQTWFLVVWHVSPALLHASFPSSEWQTTQVFPTFDVSSGTNVLALPEIFPSRFWITTEISYFVPDFSPVRVWDVTLGTRDTSSRFPCWSKYTIFWYRVSAWRSQVKDIWPFEDRAIKPIAELFSFLG